MTSSAEPAGAVPGPGDDPAGGGPAPAAATGSPAAEVAQYVEAVRVALADLPPAVRDSLVEDLPEHLAEVLAEGGGPLVDRLGTPQAYAAELRAAAGTPPGQARRGGFAERAGAARRELRAGLRTADRRIGTIIGYASASEFLRLLRPAWWVLRGYLAAMLVVSMLDSDQELGLLPRLGGNALVALLVLAGFVAGSIWLGRREGGLTRWPRYWLRSATVLLVLVALIGFVDVDSQLGRQHYGEVYYDNDRYGHVRDVYVYDQQGRLLRDVRLFDQDGAPIRLGAPWCAAEQERPPMPGDSYPYCPGEAPFGPPVRPGPGTEPFPAAPPPASPSPAASPTSSPAPSPSPASSQSGASPASSQSGASPASSPSGAVAPAGSGPPQPVPAPSGSGPA